MTVKIIQPRYELWGFDCKKSFTDTVTKSEVLSIDRQSVDHFMALDFGIWAFRTANGEWIEYHVSEKSLGPTSLKILDVVRCEPGEFFSPADVKILTGINSLKNNNNLSARWMALRLAHNETGKAPHFLLSKRSGGMGIAWNAKRSFIQITRIKLDNKNIQVMDI